MNDTAQGIETLTTAIDGNADPAGESCNCGCAAQVEEIETEADSKLISGSTPVHQQFESFS